jgi:hypothetical protein
VSWWDVEEEDGGWKLSPGTGNCCSPGWAHVLALALSLAALGMWDEAIDLLHSEAAVLIRWKVSRRSVRRDRLHCL